MATTKRISTLARLVAVLVLAALAAGTTSAAAPAFLTQQASPACNPTHTLLASGADAVSISQVAARARSNSRHAYSWPLKPFERQHPVRAFFDDPRIHEGATHAFHFGIDISAPDGTKVYAVEAGKVHIESGMAVSVVAPDGSHTFGYWHILPLVRNHQFVQRHELLGVIGPGWEHVHFAESRDRRYLNPLRPGALGPYADRMPPTVAGVSIARADSGVLTVVADAFDTPSPRVPGTWADEPVTPALLQWRLVRAGARAGRWHTAADFRLEMLGQDRFHDIYAPGTEQNHRGDPGRFCFYLAKRWQPGLADGEYELQVRATDTRGNTGQLVLRLGSAAGTIA
jgi:Peptidase family M23